MTDLLVTRTTRLTAVLVRQVRVVATATTRLSHRRAVLVEVVSLLRSLAIRRPV